MLIHYDWQTYFLPLRIWMMLTYTQNALIDSYMFIYLFIYIFIYLFFMILYSWQYVL